MKYLTGTSGGPELARLHQDVLLWDDQFRNLAPAVGAEHLCIWLFMCPNPSPCSSIFKALLTVWRAGMPLPSFTETEWVSDYLIPYLLGGSLLLSHEKLLCSKRDHRLRHYMINLYLKYMRDTSIMFPRSLCRGAALAMCRHSTL